MKFLIINQNYPLEDYKAQETLDLALGLSTFEQEVSLLFIDKAILQLLKTQQPKLNYRKDFIATFKAFPIYDIKNVYFDEESFHKYHLKDDDLIITGTIINKEQTLRLIEKVNIVLSV